MAIQYALEPSLSIEDFVSVLRASKLSLRRPVDDLSRLQCMIDNASIIVTARTGGRLIGVSRAITDFAYCCYLSDLAVDESFQKQGIGKRLIEETHLAAGMATTLILVSAPASEGFYQKINLHHFHACYGIPRTK